MAGRPRKPIEKHQLEGTYRPDRHGPVNAADLPEPPPALPPGLPDDVAAKWVQAVDLLAGVVKRRDVPLLIDLCRWLARSDKVAAKLDAMAAEEKGFNQTLIAAGIVTDKLLQLSGRFGMTPSDRAKLRVDHATTSKARVSTRPRTKLDAQPPKK